jgi:hypothetical protein
MGKCQAPSLSIMHSCQVVLHTHNLVYLTLFQASQISSVPVLQKRPSLSTISSAGGSSSSSSPSHSYSQIPPNSGGPISGRRSSFEHSASSHAGSKTASAASHGARGVAQLAFIAPQTTSRPVSLGRLSSGTKSSGFPNIAMGGSTTARS